jgi:hypothetical protein
VGKANGSRECVPDGVPTIQQRRSIEKMVGTARRAPCPPYALAAAHRSTFSLAEETRNPFHRFRVGRVAVLNQVGKLFQFCVGQIFVGGLWTSQPFGEFFKHT